MLIFVLVCFVLGGVFFILKEGSQFESPQWSSSQKKFFNPWQKKISFMKIAKIWKFLLSKRKKWLPQRIKIHCDGKPREQDLKVTNIGHATLLIQCGFVNLITDPLFSDHAGPFGRFGPKRIKEPGLPIEMLPPIDLVFISHNHYDHLDAFSVRALDQQFHPIFIVPLGVGKTLTSWGIKGKIIELDWWQTYEFQDLLVISVPAQHWSRRSLFDTNKTLWMGGVFEFKEKESVYFAGDTGYGAHFAQISERFPALDLGLLPIGSYKPIEIMKTQHMGPTEAVLAAKEMNIKKMIPIHFDVFALGSEKFEEAKDEVLEAAEKEQMGLCCIEVGESYRHNFSK